MRYAQSEALSVPIAIAATLVVTLVGGAAAQERSPAQILSEAYNASGTRLFHHWVAQPGNIVFSPYSIGTAMAMALAGARDPVLFEASKVRQALQAAALYGHAMRELSFIRI